MTVTARPAGPGDAAAVRDLLLAAFGQPGEADLVDRLRSGGRLALELVADRAGAVAGHVACSPVRIGDAAGPWWGLAPLATAPGLQRRGIGSALVRAAIAGAREAGCGLLVLLGEPAFYGRFGFAPAGDLGLRCIYPAPPECFMALRLGAAAVPAGTVHYDPAFDAL